jgi:hypothetical protein
MYRLRLGFWTLAALLLVAGCSSATVRPADPEPSLVATPAAHYAPPSDTSAMAPMPAPVSEQEAREALAFELRLPAQTFGKHSPEIRIDDAGPGMGRSAVLNYEDLQITEQLDASEASAAAAAKAAVPFGYFTGVRWEDYVVEVSVDGHDGYAWDAVPGSAKPNSLVVPDAGVVFSDGRLSFALLSTSLSRAQLVNVAESMR